jgi:uncharacterized protein YndB with AHSA1/START domain
MLRLLAILLAVLLIAAGSFLLYALLRSADLHIERRVAIAAPAPRVYGLIVDLHQWPYWWKNERLDGPRQITHRGPPQGVGAELETVGKTMHTFRITRVEPNGEVEVQVTGTPTNRIDYRLRFVLTETAAGCDVTLQMDRHLEYWEKLIDAGTRGLGPILGEGFERGLQELKQQAESG